MKLALNSGIQTSQILTTNDEVCIPSLSSILLDLSKTFNKVEKSCYASKKGCKYMKHDVTMK